MIVRFDRLKNMAPDTYSIYCDGSGIQWVTTHQEGENKDKPFADGKGILDICPHSELPAGR
jgi:hypothetical protein